MENERGAMKEINGSRRKFNVNHVETRGGQPQSPGRCRSYKESGRFEAGLSRLLYGLSSTTRLMARRRPM